MLQLAILKEIKKEILESIFKAKEKGEDIIVFPEMVLTGYPPEDLLYRDHFINDNINSLNNIVKKVEGIYVIIGFVDKSKEGIYNAAAVIADGKIDNVYRKRKLPNYGVFDEKRYFLKGRGFDGVFVVKGVKCAVNICEDMWDDKGVFFDQVKKGAKVFFNISASPYDYTKMDQRHYLIKKRARQTKVSIFYTNLVGGQDELVFDGGSFVVNDYGKIVASAKMFQEDMLCLNWSNLKIVENKKFVSKNLSERAMMYEALVLGTRDYIQKNGFSKVVIGLSGGIDSALVTAIAVDAIGKDNVLGVSMPSRYSLEETRSDARTQAECLGIMFKEISIEEPVRAFDNILKGHFEGKEPNVAEENIQARIRGNILMALSNKFGYLVLTTGNKSELAVGYCTLYGDMSGGFAVIKDLPKTKVYDLSNYRNSLGKDLILQSIMDREPSAELRLGQKDKDFLPSYDVLDKILTQYVQERESFGKISKKVCKEATILTKILVDRSEHKRRQAPLGVKITPCAFGRDWRLPITNKYNG